MPTRIGRAKLSPTKSGRVKVEVKRKPRSVSAAIGAEKKAKRDTAKWTKAAKGKATVTRKGR